ncbi:SAM-dependent methyltransferase [Fischerella thermalis]|uniref:S-adenosyl-L-methionine-dependent methyltransferase n=1 Tax=Fischerella thermalis CCMEE 5318 TaxID=2019666 RepID=A0A2N6L7J5_9CYAN|nr:SAM-dependent methyltransferase [Fischerella thermalis]PMB18025.1 SAM-dependent methyltransferase [Fischerella thermalis CCMEE 5318]
MAEAKNLLNLSSRMMAVARALETQKPDGLFKDPLAAILAGDDLIAEITPKVQEYEDKGVPIFSVRTRFFDDFLISQIAQVRQVVVLGAGMDTRAFRLPWHPDTKIYELDQPEVIEYKESILKNRPSKCQRFSIGIDIRKNWSDLLIAKGYLVETSSIWILEGFIYYLSSTEVHTLLTTITQLSSPGSWLIADFIGSFFVNQKTEGLSKYWQYGCDEPEELFSTYNWEAFVVQAGDEQANYGRFTYKLPPRNVINAPHYFLVKAILKQ